MCFSGKILINVRGTYCNLPTRNKKKRPTLTDGKTIATKDSAVPAVPVPMICFVSLAPAIKYGTYKDEKSCNCLLDMWIYGASVHWSWVEAQQEFKGIRTNGYIEHTCENNWLTSSTARKP